jgi:putative membrane protein
MRREARGAGRERRILMDRIQAALSGSGAFAVTFAVSLALLAAFAAIYSAMTSHHEMRLIRSGNRAAALSFGGALVGFVIPVGRAVEQSVSTIDLVAWSAMAFVAQLVAYGVAALVVPHLRKSIEHDHVASGILLAALAIAIGVLNAAAMTL